MSEAGRVLLSMTGFGEARIQTDTLAVMVEVRAVNNRHLKLTVRGTEPYPMLEAEVEKVVRRHIHRGTLLLQIRVDRQARANELRLNATALKTYLTQVRDICSEAGNPEYAALILSGALSLPGVLPDTIRTCAQPEDEWPIVERTIDAALQKLDSMRRDEGRAMAAELSLHQRHIADQLELIRRHIPAVTTDYRQRLLERMRVVLAEAGVGISPEHLIREVALFADRTDIAEETTRLASHLHQFAEIVNEGDEGAGRKLEFVVQEMGRETNTIGSKAGDVTISRHVVEIKATLEKIRELVLNIE